MNNVLRCYEVSCNYMFFSVNTYISKGFIREFSTKNRTPTNHLLPLIPVSVGMFYQTSAYMWT